jgi:aryl-alcohol dehydrogenase-like predicted oxidoreductase
VLPHLADSAATLRFASRFSALTSAGFYREIQGLTVSSIGIGTYLGEMDAATDSSYTEAVRGALAAGVNFIDTSLNYRNQRSERSIGTALRQAVEAREVHREEVVISTKAGYLVPDAVPAGILSPNDVVGGMHSMAPAFLRDQLDRSRGNLGLDAIDVLYLHNPETQLAYISQTEFLGRVRPALLRNSHMARLSASRAIPGGSAARKTGRHSPRNRGRSTSFPIDPAPF